MRQEKSLARTVSHVALAQRAADFSAFGKKKCVRHRSGDNEDIDLAGQ